MTVPLARILALAVQCLENRDKNTKRSHEGHEEHEEHEDDHNCYVLSTIFMEGIS
jgi:hypothetical protein